MSHFTDVELAAHLAETAGKLLLEIRNSGVFSAKALGKAGDQTANQFLIHAIREARPDDGFLSEETQCDGTRLGMSRVWIIDPVDGTREYGASRPDWAVHVGLAVDGAPRIGAVALPDRHVTLCNGWPPPLTPPRTPPRMLVSQTRPAAEAVSIAEAIGADLVAMGSAGAKAMAIVLGEADIYLHTGGQYEWDSCAPAAVAAAAGLHVSRANGAPLRYNNRDPYLPDLLICRQGLAGRVLAEYHKITA